MNTNPLAIAGIVILILVVALIVFIVVKRMKYVKAIKQQGWSLDANPPESTVYGLNCPPFGIGSDRSVDDLVTGTSVVGDEFRAFDYRADGWSSMFCCFPLASPLPELHLSAVGRERKGVAGEKTDAGGVSVVARDPEWARQATSLVGHMPMLLAEYPEATASLDGSQLVLGGLPSDPAGLAAALDLAHPLVAAAKALRASYAPTIPREFSVYGRPTWIYRNRDDDYLDRVEHTITGHDHEAYDIVEGGAGELSLLALKHRWKTTETRTKTDSEGNTTTETYEVDHYENIMEITFDFPFGDLSLNWNEGGPTVKLESIDFNKRYKLRAKDERFAYDIFHPQMMELVLASEPHGFEIRQGRIRFDNGTSSPDAVEKSFAFIQAFFGRTRSYVWDNLGLSQPPNLG